MSSIPKSAMNVLIAASVTTLNSLRIVKDVTAAGFCATVLAVKIVLAALIY